MRVPHPQSRSHTRYHLGVRRVCACPLGRLGPEHGNGELKVAAESGSFQPAGLRQDAEASGGVAPGPGPLSLGMLNVHHKLQPFTDEFLGIFLFPTFITGSSL